ncbi:MAG: DUF1207 domain-containing protein [Microscillaceae bacterium]|nr:DUF1207 domain-containing protein [Microscillaceae bacterium]MDW8461613.1 DUF1207 domain-containing protein [Cytophagales bacterium]
MIYLYYFKVFASFSLFLLFSWPKTFAQSDTLASKKREFFPQGQLFLPLVLDPTECQTHGLLAISSQNNQFFDGLYINASIGFSKGIIRWKAKNTTQELRFEAAAFMQFEVENKRRVLGNLINTDYRASVPYIISKGKNQYRLRIFHNSSHLGDDFLFTRQVTWYLPNPMNFEQLDFTHSYQEQSIRYYYGAGLVITPYSRRKRLSFQVGTYYHTPLSQNQLSAWYWFIGLDLKSMQETDFYPNTKFGVGLALKQPRGQFAYLLLEMYQGHLPYSLFERNRTIWVGAGMYWQVW